MPLKFLSRSDENDPSVPIRSYSETASVFCSTEQVIVSIAPRPSYGPFYPALLPLRPAIFSLFDFQPPFHAMDDVQCFWRVGPS
jgi:hypothetical protein